MDCPKTIEKMLWKIVFGVALALAHQFCYCDEHTYGIYEGIEKELFEKELFDQAKDEGVVRSKNYTLIFKYIGDESTKKISRAVFNVQNAVGIWALCIQLFKINRNLA